ncbi:MAG TPA: amino acid adenylation domain-containing protein [Thermoanaerobaculia bacterium]|jgi:amino acid adenylation domain-containing protein|nr:amino acid adenylation domain-containing protein [Thermoanaerobaculia bacterium]
MSPDLSPDQLALLVMRAKKKRAAEASPGAPADPRKIVRRDLSVPTPASFAQQRLWLLDRIEPGGTAYNMPAPARLRGALDLPALEAALAEIVRRHASLRTTFEERDGEPVQVIAPAGPWRLPVADLSALPGEVREAERNRLVLEDKCPFDLARGPLFRAGLLKLGPEEHMLLLDTHHIISDGWSFGVFFRELGALYGAFRERRLSPLPELPVQFADFAAWQREWLQGPVLDEQIAWWRGRLAGAPPALELPTDRPRPAVQSHRGSRAVRSLSPGLAAQLRELSRKEGVSMFMTLLAGFQLLLARLSGQDDVVVGSPSAGRSRTEIEGLIGLFLNTLVLRTDLSGDPTFRELLVRVRDGVLGAYRYQDLPFERLLEELKPERQLSRTPIFQVLFNYVSLSDLAMELAGVAVEPLRLDESDSKFDFTLYVREHSETLYLDVVYNADLFEPGRMEELLSQLEHLMEQAVADPGSRVGSLSLVTAGSALPDPTQSTSGDWWGAGHQSLSRHAGLQPGRIAVRDARGEAWTYAELEARTNRLARFLIDHGVEKGDAVAVWSCRNASLVEALLGTLKAGAAFLILDPAYPAPRLAEYVRIGRPTAWIGVPGAPPPPPELEQAWRFRVELPLEGGPADDPGVPIGPDDAACITFTSGSTGVPKGVVGLHGALTHFHPWMGERFGLHGGDRYGMLSALSHDPLQRDLLMPVWFGAELVVPDPEGFQTPGYLADWLRRERVTVLNLTPAMMELILESGKVRELPDLRLAFVVGDQLRKSDVERLYRLAPSLVCVNLYGATETQRALSFFEVPRGLDLLGKEVVPLGRGFEGCQLLVLNRADRLAGVGELGEIHIRSRHLARGYLDDEALTAERFRPNPFVAAPEPGDRLYRTGDLGRYLPGGGVEMYGRADSQVKLRGFRIEMGEVEAALSRFPGVRECVAVIREDEPGRKRLVAYLVGDAARPDELRAFLADRLPDYMVPSAYVALPALPLTRTGKVDRLALPVPPEPGTEARSGNQSPVLELLAGIWADLLGVSEVGPGAHFFELGGHSLLATRLVARIRRALGLEVPARAVFEEPVLAGFAALVERRVDGGDEQALPPLVPVPREQPLALSFAQQRLWFLDQLEPGSLAYNLAGAIRLVGPLGVSALRRVLSEIVRRHESLRTTFPEAEGQPWQRIAPPEAVDLPVVDLSGLPAPLRDPEARRLASAEVRRPYDLAAGPLLRNTLIRMAGEEHALLIGLQHIVADGWSLGIFVRELGVLYRAFAAGGESPFPELALQYADFAAWQRSWLAGPVLEASLSYWKQHLAGAPPVVELPLDRPRPAARRNRGARTGLALGGGLAQRLSAVARRLDATPFMVSLGALATLLWRHGGQPDMVIGTPIANRSRAELEDLIGLFANTLALRTGLDGDPGFAELMRRVRETALGAYAHQDIPFERLVDGLQTERDLSYSPVFQVMLAFQNLPFTALELPGLALSPLELDGGRSQFDLSLFLLPGEGTEGLTARLEYDTDLFDEGTAVRLLARFRTLLENIAEAPDRRLSELPLFTLEERSELLATGRRAPETPETPEDIPGLLVQQLFERTAAARPGAVALSWEGGALTYAELNARANRLAHRLRRLGIGPESRAAVCLERSPSLLTALLGVLKAGGAYVPLDPAYPADRLAWVLEDSRAAVLVTGGEAAKALPLHGARVLDLDTADLSEESAMDPLGLSGPENLAYVIYTSGSTGRPKGVAVRQSGVVNFLASMARRPGLGPDDVLLAVTTIAFDIAVLELFLPLSVGARVELADRETAADGLRLCERLAASGATAMQATPATWRLLLDAGWEGSPGLRILCGGEALPPDLARELLARTGSLWNVYGPTETTVWSTVQEVSGADLENGRPVALGDPVANTGVYLLTPFERGLEPVPLNVPGELYLGGEGLARGYFGRPDLTAERFVPDPASGTPGARLYRTGDLARRRTRDGALEFLGRADHQVKIRGFRIELGEIEAVLAGIPAVRECAVVVREDVPGSPRLVACLAFHEGRADTPETLQAALRERLPEYMVPHAFAVLPALPLTPNGKIDRRALLAGPAPAAGSSAAPVLPRNGVEEGLAAVWAEVLRLERLGVHDNFFSLGGDSILAIQVVTRSRRHGLRFTPRQLFQNQTIAQLATVVEAMEAIEETPSPAAPVVFPAPMDFPESGLSQSDLDDLLAELAE